MKANELRVGNWIRKYMAGGWDFREVRASDITELATTPPFSENMMFQAIPLTAEIMEQTGFEKVEQYNGDPLWEKVVAAEKLTFRVWLDGEARVHSTNDHESVAPLRKTKHLHQLQNLYYALSGEELQIHL